MDNKQSNVSTETGDLEVFRSENGRDIALFQGDFAKELLIQKGLKIGTRYTVYKKKKFSGKLEPLDKSIVLAGISEETGGVRAEDAQLSKNVDWYKDSLQANPNTISVWGHHDGSSEVGILDYWKSMSLQQDGSIDIGGGHFLKKDEDFTGKIVKDGADNIDKILAS